MTVQTRRSEPNRLLRSRSSRSAVTNVFLGLLERGGVRTVNAQYPSR